MKKAFINKIIPFSSVDGPGNRTVIFFQGCNFSCLYCHNPETIKICNNCGKCVENCKSDALKIIDKKVQYYSENCTNCDICIKTCSNFSSPKVEQLTINELLQKIEKLKIFISGITISGGECSFQYEFLKDFLKEMKHQKISTFIDTNAFLELEKMIELSNYFEKAMIDLKWFDNETHIKLTGKSNKFVLDNADFLIRHHKVYEIRTVVFPYFENFKDNIRQTAKFISERNPDLRFKLIKYRKFGVKNAEKYPEPDDNMLNELKLIAENEGCRNVILL